MVARPSLAVFAVALATAPAAASPTARVAFVERGSLVVLDLATHSRHVVMRNAGDGPIAWSGDGKLVSSGGRIAGGPTLPATKLVWAPAGERAAYVTSRGGIVVWTPTGSHQLEPAGWTSATSGWSATTLAWSSSGQLALGRAVCRPPCSATHREIWVWNGRTLHRIFSLSKGLDWPMPVTWTSAGKVVWWRYPDSASIAVDGVGLYAGRTHIGQTLMYPDFVVRCGSKLAWADGGDRFSTHGKRILLDGRDVSRDRTRSWVSPSCRPDGSVVVAAGGRDHEARFGLEHRAIWQLQPSRKQLTHPARGWTDEDPHVLADGSVLFVRTHESSRKRNGRSYVAVTGEIDRLTGQTLDRVTTIHVSGSELGTLGNFNYYGH